MNTNAVGERPILSIVVPTLNESKNIPILYESLSKALPDIRWELVIVDDNSTDDTPKVLIDLCSKYANFRYLRRFGRTGISTAGIEGMMSCAAPYIAVMDADGQHDETKLAEMLGYLQRDEAEIAVGSRFAEGANLVEFTAFRTKLSLYSNRIAQRFFRVPLEDSMGNFFMLKREVIEHAAPYLCGRGQKLLLDVILVGPDTWRVKEVPIVFGVREHGESKLSHIAAIDFGLQLWERKFGKVLPAKAVLDTGAILAYSVLTTFFTWFTMKMAHVFTGSYPRAAVYILVGGLPALFLAFWAQRVITPKRRRAKGKQLLGELVFFILIALPFLALSAWITEGVTQPGDPRLRLLFGASLTSSIGLVVSSAWRKEALSRR
ncbi:MAG TPA: polyprenol monophosphomannose synthase [Fimbriimonas sp.]|nr:polyprenol monophosphomannose synthase [Fimbriimonas sp.]